MSTLEKPFSVVGSSATHVAEVASRRSSKADPAKPSPVLALGSQIKLGLFRIRSGGLEEMSGGEWWAGFCLSRAEKGSRSPDKPSPLPLAIGRSFAQVASSTPNPKLPRSLGLQGPLTGWGTSAAGRRARGPRVRTTSQRLGAPGVPEPCSALQSALREDLPLLQGQRPLRSDSLCCDVFLPYGPVCIHSDSEEWTNEPRSACVDCRLVSSAEVDGHVGWLSVQNRKRSHLIKVHLAAEVMAGGCAEVFAELHAADQERGSYNSRALLAGPSLASTVHLS